MNNDCVSQPSAQRPRVSVADMLRTVGLLLVPVVAFVGYQSLTREVNDPAPPVDYLTAAEAAREAAPFDVLAPTALPQG